MNKNKKRNYDEVFTGNEYIYGIVSTAVDWIYIKLSDNGISILPIADAHHLQLSIASIDTIQFEEQLSKIIGTIV